MIMLGIGYGLVMPACTGALMGTLPREHTGVGSATNGTFLQIGSALGVAIVGSTLSRRYERQINSALVTQHVPQAIHDTILGSLGAALGVAQHVRGPIGELLSQTARSAFISGMDLGLRVAAAVAFAGLLVALLTLPFRATPGENPK